MELELIHALQRFASPALDQVMLLITQIGSESAYIAMVTVAFSTIDAQRSRTLAIILLAGFYANQLLKGVFATSRPFEIDPDVLRGAAAAETATGPGFPSGHAQGASTFWGMAAYYVKRRWFSVAALALIVLISLSRLYLGVHMPIDILGGLVLGALTVGVAAWLERSQVGLGKAAIVVLGVAIPLTLHLVMPTVDSGLLLGALAAFLVGPELVRHDTSGPLAGRVILGALALVLVFGALFGSSALLPEDVKRMPLVSFTRYLVIGGVGTVAIPLLGRALRLVPAPGRGSADDRIGR